LNQLNGYHPGYGAKNIKLAKARYAKANTAQYNPKDCRESRILTLIWIRMDYFSKRRFQSSLSDLFLDLSGFVNKILYRILTFLELEG